MKAALIVFVFIFVFAASNVYAGGWGAGGCGVGTTYVIKKADSRVMLILQYWTNMSFYRPSSITTGTSGCGGSSEEAAMNLRKSFIGDNLANLNVEIAKGEGENLTQLAKLYGCKEDNTNTFGNVLKENYQAIYSSPEVSAEQVFNAVTAQVSANETLANSCM